MSVRCLSGTPDAPPDQQDLTAAVTDGEERLRALLHDAAAALDAPLRHRYVADGREDVRVEPRLALLHRPRLFAALDAVLEVLLAEHPDRPARAHVSADGRRLLGVERSLGLGEDLAGLLF